MLLLHSPQHRLASTDVCWPSSQRQPRATRVSGASHWRNKKEPHPSQTSCYSFIITKDVQAAPNGFSQKTVSGIRNHKVLFPSTAVTSQTSGYHLAAAPFPWALPLHATFRKGRAGIQQCTKAEFQKSGHFGFTSHGAELRSSGVCRWIVTALLSASLDPKATKS